VIRTHIAAAVLALGLAGLGGAVVAVAAPAHAETETVTRVDGTAMDGTAGPAVDDARQVPETLADATRGPEVSPVPAPGSAATQRHVPFPHNPAPHSEHNGQGHKGSNELPHPHVGR
jgi:hypothetical protein